MAFWFCFLFLLFFSPFKGPGGHAIYRRNEKGAWNAKCYISLHEGTDDYVTTKFSYPWCSARKSPPDIGNRVRVVRVAKSVKFASGSKELGSILLCHRLKKYPDLVDLASIRSRIHAHLKIFTLESGFKKLRMCLPDSPDTCRRKPYQERKSCGLKNSRIRVDVALERCRCRSDHVLRRTSL